MKNSRNYILALVLIVLIGLIVVVSIIFNTDKPSINNINDDGQGSQSKAVTVFIDAGHGGEDPGTSYKDILEKNLNLDISNRLDKLLQEEGFKTVMSRTDDTNPDLKGRIVRANELNVDAFVSVHNNFMPDDESYSGVELLCAAQNGEAENARTGHNLASNLLESMEALKAKSVKIKIRPDLGVVRLTKMPGIVVEVGYLSNVKERENLTSSRYQEKAAKSITKGIIKYFEKIGAQKESGVWNLSR